MTTDLATQAAERAREVLEASVCDAVHATTRIVCVLAKDHDGYHEDCRGHTFHPWHRNKPAGTGDTDD